MKIESIQIKDLPRQLLDKAWQQIIRYSVGIMGVHKEGSGEKGELIGSGTLIRIENVPGILTAQHVVDPDKSTGFKEATHIGLSFLPYVHKLAVEKNQMGIIEVAKAIVPSKGPDLAVLILPSEKTGWIEATKQFWNISFWRNRILPNPMDKGIGVWFVCGFPGELTRSEGPRSGFGEVKGFQNFSGESGAEREWVDGEYDYVDISVLYEDKSELPKSFGGFSGAGLWQVPVHKTEDCKIQSKDPIFSGVAFYQTGVKDNHRSIRCHGRRSVYEMVYRALRRKTK